MDLQSEQFQTLLTEALRAGPGSPQWHEAITTLRSSGGAESDEYQLLIRARQDLESGRDYRAVRAGPGFSSKVLSAIEQEEGRSPPGLPSANILALLAAGAILAVIVVVAVILLKSNVNPNRQQIDQLRGVYFINRVAALNLESATEVGPEWRMAGEVPLKVAREGLRPATTQASPQDKREYRAGAIETSEPIAADQPILVDVTFKASRLSDLVIPQVLVSEEPLDPAKAASSRELVWLLKGGQPQVLLPDLSVPAKGDRIAPKGVQTITVKIRLNRDTAIIESGDRRLYEGPHMLSTDKPRYVGVRFLRKVGDGSDGLWLSSIQVLRP